MSDTDSSYRLCCMMLSLAVPLWILSMQERGGPTEEDWFNCQVFGDLLGMPPADTALLFRSKVEGVTAMMFNDLARTLATMSFLPGGVTAFDGHWESKPWAVAEARNVENSEDT